MVASTHPQYYMFMYSYHTENRDNVHRFAYTDNVPDNILTLMEAITKLRELPAKLSDEEKKNLNEYEYTIKKWFYGDKDPAALDKMNVFKHHARLPGPVWFFDVTWDL